MELRLEDVVSVGSRSRHIPCNINWIREACLLPIGRGPTLVVVVAVLVVADGRVVPLFGFHAEEGVVGLGEAWPEFQVKDEVNRDPCLDSGRRTLS